MNGHTTFVTAVILATALSLGGCTLLPEREPATHYRLPSATLSHQTTISSDATIPPSIPLQLGIASPEADHLLSSNRIVVYPARHLVNVYEGARWHENTPDMLQARLIEGLQQRQLFKGVNSDRLPHDLLLLSELRHFQSEYDTQPPSVHIQLDVQLVHGVDYRPISTKSLTHRVTASSTALTDVVDAFGQASDALTEALAHWLEEQSQHF